MSTFIDERYELAINRIREIRDNPEVIDVFKGYFSHVATFILTIINPSYDKEYNNKLYEDIVGDNYEKSYANPTFCSKIWNNLTDLVNDIQSEKPHKMGTSDNKDECEDAKYENKKLIDKYNTSQLLCFLYTEIRGLIPYMFEYKYYNDVRKKTEIQCDSMIGTSDNSCSVGSDMSEDRLANLVSSYKEIITIFLELFIEVYVLFNDAYLNLNDNIGNGIPDSKELHEILYWFMSDNCDIISPLRIRSQLDPSLDFATNIIINSTLTGNDFNTDYLYNYGEYVSDNEIKVAEFLADMPQSDIDKMASTFTEGYRIGFVKAGKPLNKKSTVNIRYNIGFERVVKAAIENFNEMGLKPAIYRAGSLSLTGNGVNKVGFTGAIANKQYDYDHKEDAAVYHDKEFINRKADVIKNAYEDMKDLAAGFAGPAVMEVFGEEPFEPEAKKECIIPDVVGRKCQVDISDRLSQIANEYIKGEERSFTIISYPIPEIGDKFSEIFAETVKLNTLDYKRYENMQQLIIDVLDTVDTVRIEGKGINQTRLTVKTQKITDATKQTSFENCVADVNIPVGEVFTSPVLKGTNGILNVSKCYLFGLNYIDLTIEFKDGMIADYSCKNFESEEENKKYIRENILHNHETLPLGEFAIGTNTTAYKMAREYNIEQRLPILIGEKTGPHFAVGDTCYSHEEDVNVYNPDGKEIICRDNELTAEYRMSNPSKAYFNCHTDITIPYDELAGIYAVREDGSEIAIIEDGLFVLEGVGELNEPLIMNKQNNSHGE